MPFVNEKLLRVVLIGVGSVALLMFVLKMVDFVRNKTVYQDKLSSSELTEMRRSFRSSDDQAPSGSHLEEYAAYQVIQDLNITGFIPPIDPVEVESTPTYQGVQAKDFEVPFIQYPNGAWIQPAGAEAAPNSEVLPGDLYAVGQVFELDTRRGTELRLAKVEMDKITIVVVDTEVEIIVRTGDLPLNEKELLGTGMTGASGVNAVVAQRPPPERTERDDLGIFQVGTADADDLAEMSEEELLASVSVGVARDKLTNEPRGLQLKRINSPLLMRMGLEQGDIVLEVNGQPARSRDGLLSQMRDFQGKSLTVRIERLGGERTLNYRLPR